MRLFVAAWPTEALASVLSRSYPVPDQPGVRWVPPADWHVTLAFLGSVPDGQVDDLVAALASLATSLRPNEATVGPHASLLGRAILCLPVSGLDEMANAVRETTGPFDHARANEHPFRGHLTLARARRGQRMPGTLVGSPFSAIWPVFEYRLVSSATSHEGPRYSSVARLPFGCG